MTTIMLVLQLVLIVSLPYYFAEIPAHKQGNVISNLWWIKKVVVGGQAHNNIPRTAKTFQAECVWLLIFAFLEKDLQVCSKYAEGQI